MLASDKKYFLTSSIQFGFEEFTKTQEREVAISQLYLSHLAQHVQRERMSISNLPTAGACDQRVGVALSNLPTAGVCDQRVLDLLYSI